MKIKIKDFNVYKHGTNSLLNFAIVYYFGLNLGKKWLGDGNVKTQSGTDAPTDICAGTLFWHVKCSHNDCNKCHLGGTTP